MRVGLADRDASVDVLEAGCLAGVLVITGPEPGGCAGVAAIDVATEDHGARGCATGEQLRELGALRVVAGDLIARSPVQVRGADIDVGGDAQPAAPLEAGLRLEVLALGSR